ncbi:gamma-glutamyl hydrolase-like [Penaeus japonicus]|uniref:gamma-glutamyl hydrolase-like n=1 Tax=Penaeus japonicus TaxID=27405 RepID=UPI001C71237C|nr:gamma-glutamyl hydrolase-like [Penaeus japonicus]
MTLSIGKLINKSKVIRGVATANSWKLPVFYRNIRSSHFAMVAEIAFTLTFLSKGSFFSINRRLNFYDTVENMQLPNLYCRLVDNKTRMDTLVSSVFTLLLWWSVILPPVCLSVGLPLLMKMALPSLLLSLLVLTASASASQDLNLRPVIGILSQELSRGMRLALSDHNYTSYIAASYVKFFEGAGARVVPILINQDDDYYRNIMRSINGLVFPGGSASITPKSGYGRAGRLLYDLLLESSANGTVLPLFATCLGFEMLMYLHANNTNPLTRCKAQNRADPLFLRTGWETSQLLGNVSEEILHTLTTTNATSNFHKYCVTPQTFEEFGLDKDYLLLSTSHDFDGVEYVSTVEHRELPFYGFQWHPEKNLYEWAYDSIPHTRNAIEAAQYTANLFVDKARQNHQAFGSEEEESAALIYNHSPVYIIKLYRSSFQQCYFFE